MKTPSYETNYPLDARGKGQVPPPRSLPVATKRRRTEQSFTLLHEFMVCMVPACSHLPELWGGCVLFFVGFLCFNTPFQNFTRISPEFHQKFIICSQHMFTIITRSLPECCKNIELENLKKGDNHNSAFPHPEVNEVCVHNCPRANQAGQAGQAGQVGQVGQAAMSS